MLFYFIIILSSALTPSRVRLWQWGLDVRAVTYATLITIRWLQEEGFLHSEEYSSSISTEEECSPSNNNSSFSNKNDHDIQYDSSSGKVINITNKNQYGNDDNSDIEEKKISKKMVKKMNEKVKKSEQIGRNGNDYYNCHSQWISKAQKICFKISENIQSSSDEFLGTVKGKKN